MGDWSVILFGLNVNTQNLCVSLAPCSMSLAPPENFNLKYSVVYLLRQLSAVAGNRVSCRSARRRVWLNSNSRHCQQCRYQVTRFKLTMVHLLFQHYDCFNPKVWCISRMKIINWNLSTIFVIIIWLEQARNGQLF